VPSRKGSPNQSTTNARAAIALFVDRNAGRLEGWLDRIAEENPKAAFDCFQSVIEYHIPKLARTESTVTIIEGVAQKLENARKRAESGKTDETSV
jgi:hypothetical protein